MGAYLSEPITNKETQLEENEELRVASSSMQGWRVSQEDAHNAIINFDDHTSFFAVYDGHGGHEVAEYTAKKLPAFIKENKDYQDGNMHKALVDCFVEFDRTIVNRDVVAELKRIAGKPEDDIEDEEEVDNLYQEATMPIEDVIAKYEANEDENETSASSEENSETKPKVLKNPHVANLAGSSGSKGVSPFLRAKDAKKNGIKDESVAKEIEFNKDNENSDITNGTDTSDKQLNSNETKTESLNNDKSNEINGEHTVQSNKLDDNSTSDNSLKVENVDKTSDKSENNIDSNDLKKDISTNKSNGNGATTVIESKDNIVGDQPEDKKLNENGLPESKGKGKGKGKGKSSTISSKTSGDCAEDSKPILQQKRASKSAAELYRNILNDDENGDDVLEEDDSDEDVVYGQDDSDSDEAEEEGDEESAEGEEEEELEDSEDDEEEEDEENGEGFIGGEFNEEDQENSLSTFRMISSYRRSSAQLYKEKPGNDSGCTAVVALLRGNELFVANAGDSRCVVCRDGKAIEMSFDHKPEDTPERDRIENAGGKVTPDGRVNGGLNLSRAIGDHAYKTNKNLPLQEQMISPVPDIRTLQIDPTKDSYIVLACDGIWNSLTSQEVVDFVSERMDKLCSTESDPKDPTTQHLKTICEELFEHCLAPDTMNDGTGMDNMTAVIVKLRSSFDGNKSAKNLLAGGSCSSTVGSSNATSSLSANSFSTQKDKINSDPISSNGDGKHSVAAKRSNEDNEESSVSETASKKIRIDDETNNSENTATA